MAGDGCVVEVHVGRASSERIPRIPALVRYQIRLVSSSIAITAVTIKYSDAEWEVWVPDREDVGVFFGGIVLSLEGVKPSGFQFQALYERMRLARTLECSQTTARTRGGKIHLSCSGPHDLSGV